MAKGIKGSIERAMLRTFDNSDRGKILRLLKNPPAINNRAIVFTSSDDYTGNPKALYEYMIEHGYNDKYEITWLFEKGENYFEFNTKNVRSLKMFNEDGTRSYEAQLAIMSAEYIFYSHNVNWVKNFRKEQLFINLWHGCGYKGNKYSDSRKIYADYYTVVGPEYVDVFEKMFNLPREIILPLGYPRNEAFHTNKSDAKAFLEQKKADAKADKVIAWLPTFRKSKVARLDEDMEVGALGLPLIGSMGELEQLNSWCRDNKILMILKQHHLQADYDFDQKNLTNIICVDNDYLKKENVELYELLANTDSLLSDYSSAAIDYMLLDKPIGYILDDFDGYAHSREWCLDNVKSYMTGNHIYTMDDLKAYIEQIARGEDPEQEKRREVCKRIHVDSDKYCQPILDYFGL